MQILIVDDKPVVLEQLRTLLADFPCEIDSAGNGLDALEKAQKKQYDLFIVDHLMPVMNGLQLVKNLEKKQLLANATLFFMTTQGASAANMTAESSLFDQLIEKPINVDLFNQVIEPLFSQINPIRSISN
ncbi:response regulator [Thalassotalea sp. 1_MG-2023]|uniref:response regulator n=1 Tax=Thalassotalea sp. 1_MG-2023 TaxID=3062680 RepID=UPI0026E37047|nr:response regulator [Thalassotalea sp. 1_MG-2023]MDO6428011.1 response regulator [Thalassotalea sp. 1_MG-2023]